MMRFRHVVGALAMVALAGSLAMAQAPEGRPAPPPEPHNLKVLPASTTTANILPIMRNFATALGTNCGFCHHWVAGGGAANDFASDEKPTKDIARVMMRMAGTVNETLAANVKKPAGELTRVECMTCHRGETIPKLPPPAARAGAPPAAAAPPAGR